MSHTVDDITAVCAALTQADLQVEYFENKLAEAKEYARLIREETGPAMMQELGIKSLKLDDGRGVSLKQEIYSQATKEEKPAIYRWLDSNGFGGIIKTAVQVNFVRGELEIAKEFMSDLQRSGNDCSLIQDVHPQTLKAFIREQLSNKAPIPLDLFKARPVWQLKVK